MTPPISAPSDATSGGSLRRLLSNEAVIPRVLSGLGVALCLAIFAEWVVFAESQLRLVLHPTNVIGVLTNVPFLVGLVYGGYWLDRSDVSTDRYLRIAGWCFGAMAVFLGLNALIQFVTTLDSLWYLVGWIRWATVLGAGVGLFIGIIEACAIERERAAERATTRADIAESQREWLDYLNSLLRHEVLNTATVIGGRAAFLLDETELDDSVRPHLETIGRQSEEMTTVIRDVRVLIEATDGETELERRDLEAVVRTEVAALHDRYDDVCTDCSVPDDVTVLADDLFPRLFSNLLANAVEHNTSRSPQVTVTGEATDDTVIVHVADDGPGISSDQLDSLFERDRNRSDTHGLGLFIVRTLTDRYGGDVTLADTGADGTTFTVELPCAGTAQSDQSADGVDATVTGTG